jgi:hypothetical protein
MATHEPPARSLDVADVTRALPETLSSVARKHERIVIEQDGAPVAAIVSLRDLEQLARLDTQRAEDFKVFERIGAAFAHETEEESERLALLALAEAREDIRREREAQKNQ